MNAHFLYRDLERVSKFNIMVLEVPLMQKTTAVLSKMLILLINFFPGKYHSVVLQDLSRLISVATLKFHLWG